MGIPEWLRGMLEEGRYRSPYHMAQEFRVPPPTVYRWLTGKVTPSAPYCMKLAEVTGTSIEDVMRMAHGDGTPAPTA